MVRALGQVRSLLESKALSVTPESLEKWPLASDYIFFMWCMTIAWRNVSRCHTVRFTRKVRSMTARSIKTLLRAHDRLVGVTGIDAYFRRSPALGSLTALCFLSHYILFKLIIYLTEESWTTSLVRATCSPPLPASTLSSQEPVSLDLSVPHCSSMAIKPCNDGTLALQALHEATSQSHPLPVTA